MSGSYLVASNALAAVASVRRRRRRRRQILRLVGALLTLAGVTLAGGVIAIGLWW